MLIAGLSHGFATSAVHEAVCCCDSGQAHLSAGGKGEGDVPCASFSPGAADAQVTAVLVTRGRRVPLILHGTPGHMHVGANLVASWGLLSDHTATPSVDSHTGE